MQSKPAGLSSLVQAAQHAGAPAVLLVHRRGAAEGTGVSGAFDLHASWTRRREGWPRGGRGRLGTIRRSGAIAAQKQGYADTIGSLPDAALRREVEMFGQKATLGSVAGEHGPVRLRGNRTQLFIYLKACGRQELNTMNLWVGVDGPM